MGGPTMVDAYIVGGATGPFRKQLEGDLADLAADVARQALTDSGLGISEVDLVCAGTVHGGEGFGQRVAARLGLGGRRVLNFENACASSSVAANEASLWVRAGESRVALVVGGEKLSSRKHQPVSESHSSYDYGAHDITWPVVYALHAADDIRHGRYTTADLARVVTKNRLHASRNPDAQFRDPVTEQDVLQARMIASPLTLLMCSAKSDGVSAAVVADSATALKQGGPTVRFAASAFSSGRQLDGPVRTTTTITREVSAAVYEKAGIGPESLDVIELHDAFASAELEHYASLGLVGASGAGELLESMIASPQSNVVVNPSGGLLSRGHPIGATGCAQIVEIYRQLLGCAGDRQVLKPRFGLVHTMGGTEFDLESNVCMIHMLEGRPSK